MGIRDFFKKKAPSPEPVTDIRLADMGQGWMVDYDMKTWEVSARHHYDWGEGDVTYEWRLESADETVYLSMESDDDVHWSVSRKIPFSRLGAGVKEALVKTGDPPDEASLDGTRYRLAETGGGHFYKDGQGPGRRMLSWDFDDDSGRLFLTIEQWGENDFEASVGKAEEEWRFSNILPGA
ncbi:conserved hypothetical protein [Candidatus Desulfarcum epimagneticum]|uniref:DUF4178 domain-containing protein n=1 Tax=uncultured Desulfobacteraceae bacterium TaxID=218296 RepID=A0A484HMP9_9BACT|nr:conserved hypothetical protein [uncultured Desulfobacteraceae bacterium]